MPPDPALSAAEDELGDEDGEGIRGSRRVLPRACDVRPELRLILGAVTPETTD